jgi:hypothetical protein
MPPPLTLDVPDPFAQKEKKMVDNMIHDRLSTQVRRWRVTGLLVIGQKSLGVITIPAVTSQGAATGAASSPAQQVHVTVGSQVPCEVAGATFVLTVARIDATGVRLTSDDGQSFLLK